MLLAARRVHCVARPTVTVMARGVCSSAFQRCVVTASASASASTSSSLSSSSRSFLFRAGAPVVAPVSRTTLQASSLFRRSLTTESKPTTPAPSSSSSSSASSSTPSTSSSSSSSSGSIAERVQAALFNNRDRLRTYLVAATALGGALLILKGGVWLVGFFSNVNFADVGEWAYVAGIATGFALVGLGASAVRLVSIRPEPVYRMVLKSVTGNTRVTSRLGEHLSSGKFRAYSVIDGGLRLSSGGKTYDGWQRWWKPKRIQILFTVTGSRGTGMVSAEVQNDYKGKPFCRVLALDVLDGKGERIILEGDPTYRIDHGPVRLN